MEINLNKKHRRIMFKKTNAISLNENSHSRICWNMSGYTAMNIQIIYCFWHKVIFQSNWNETHMSVMFAWHTLPCTYIRNIVYFQSWFTLLVVNFEFLYPVTLGIFTWKKFGRIPGKKQNKTETIWSIKTETIFGAID